jgi:hypothetical protein
MIYKTPARRSEDATPSMGFINAHGFDSNRPQLIYKMLINHKLKPIQQ